MRTPQEPHIHQLCSQSAPSGQTPVLVVAFITLVKSVPTRSETAASAAPDGGVTSRAQAPGPRPACFIITVFLMKF